jgi:hypothetical protein
MCEGSRLESASSAVGCHTSRAETNCRGRRELFRSGTLFSRSVNACTVLAVEVRRGGTKRMTCVGDAGLDLGGVLPRRAVGGDLVQRVGHVGGWCWADRGLSACRRGKFDNRSWNIELVVGLGGPKRDASPWLLHRGPTLPAPTTGVACRTYHLFITDSGLRLWMHAASWLAINAWNHVCTFGATITFLKKYTMTETSNLLDSALYCLYIGMAQYRSPFKMAVVTGPAQWM